MQCLLESYRKGPKNLLLFNYLLFHFYTNLRILQISADFPKMLDRVTIHLYVGIMIRILVSARSLFTTDVMAIPIDLLLKRNVNCRVIVPILVVWAMMLETPARINGCSATTITLRRSNAVTSGIRVLEAIPIALSCFQRVRKGVKFHSHLWLPLPQEVSWILCFPFANDKEAG